MARASTLRRARKHRLRVVVSGTGRGASRSPRRAAVRAALRFALLAAVIAWLVQALARDAAFHGGLPAL